MEGDEMVVALATLFHLTLPKTLSSSRPFPSALSMMERRRGRRTGPAFALHPDLTKLPHPPFDSKCNSLRAYESSLSRIMISRNGREAGVDQDQESRRLILIFT